MRRAVRDLSPYLWHHKKGVFLGLGSLIAKDVFSAAIPFVIGQGIDSLTHGFRMRTLLLFAGLLMGLSLAKGLFQYWMRVVLCSISRDVEYEIRNDLFAARNRAPGGWAAALLARCRATRHAVQADSHVERRIVRDSPRFRHPRRRHASRRAEPRVCAHQH